jgi:hypothetical protein
MWTCMTRYTSVSLTLISVTHNHMTDSNHLFVLVMIMLILLKKFNGITENEMINGYQLNGLYIIDDVPGIK